MIKLKSFKDAWRGIVLAVKSQSNMKLHLVAMILVIAVGIFFGFSAWEWCFIALAVALVLSMETMNTAVEELVNLVSPEHRPAAGRIKDLAAGAVLLAALGAAVVGFIILASHL